MEGRTQVSALEAGRKRGFSRAACGRRLDTGPRGARPRYFDHYLLSAPQFLGDLSHPPSDLKPAGRGDFPGRPVAAGSTLVQEAHGLVILIITCYQPRSFWVTSATRRPI